MAKYSVQTTSSVQSMKTQLKSYPLRTYKESHFGQDLNQTLRI
jgi:hypothetical protein